MVKARVLIIEDNPGWQEILEKAFKQEGYIVNSAKNAKDAMDALKAPGLHLITMDLNLVDDEGTNREGLRLLSFIGMFNPCARAIVLTAYSGHQRDVFRASYGVYEYFLKSEFDQTTFLKTARDAIQEALDCELGKTERPAYPEF